MIRRHPHVFGGEQVSNSEDVLTNWEKIKTKERKDKSSNKKKRFLSGIAKHLPALQTAYQIGVKTSRIGFDWDTHQQVESKVEEEWAEYKEAAKSGNKDKIKEELGDMLFTLAQLVRKYNLEPEDILRNANKKFMKRFEHIEDNIDIHNSQQKDLEKLWQKAKQLEKQGNNK
jgi:MazG family protein